MLSKTTRPPGASFTISTIREFIRYLFRFPMMLVVVEKWLKYYGECQR